MLAWSRPRWPNPNREDTAISRVVREDDRALRGKQIRLITEDNQQLGIVAFDKAMAKAKELGYDMVLIADQADPPVCRMMNYGKFLYEQSKREREQRKKKPSQKNKEVKFHTNIDEHDFEIKITHILDFLEKGFRVRVSLYMRGREVTHKELGFGLLKRVGEAVGEIAIVEQDAREMGRSISMQFAPKAKKA